jgi:glycosyltransferase involved in cell wall biosynthesis
MSSAEAREDISNSQRQRILEHYPWQHIAARYADVYRSALDSHGPAELRTSRNAPH